MRSLLLISVVACGSGEAETKPDPCTATALGLGSAKPLTAWKPPADCTAKASSSPKVLPTASDAHTLIECKDPKGNLGVDFKTKSVVITTSSWSPATIGISAFDDGKQITLVSRQRSPCKNDPQPMPTPPITSLFLGGIGARTFGQASCTVVTKCP